MQIMQNAGTKGLSLWLGSGVQAVWRVTMRQECGDCHFSDGELLRCMRLKSSDEHRLPNCPRRCGGRQSSCLPGLGDDVAGHALGSEMLGPGEGKCTSRDVTQVAHGVIPRIAPHVGATGMCNASKSPAQRMTIGTAAHARWRSAEFGWRVGRGEALVPGALCRVLLCNAVSCVLTEPRLLMAPTTQ